MHNALPIKIFINDGTVTAVYVDDRLPPVDVEVIYDDDHSDTHDKLVDYGRQISESPNYRYEEHASRTDVDDDSEEE